MLLSLMLRALTPLLVIIILLALDSLDGLAQTVRSQFMEDHRRVICGQFAAFKANAESGLAYLMRRGDVPDGEAVVGAWIDEWTPGSASASPSACEAVDSALYRQQNEALPGDYPNWWYR